MKNVFSNVVLADSDTWLITVTRLWDKWITSGTLLPCLVCVDLLAETWLGGD